ncbi:MAG: nucleotidyltransferase family protein [Gemmatimonadota bacterium]|nr:nucleotidyltransferase family protein [Gemmatimonadota bacterium]
MNRDEVLNVLRAHKPILSQRFGVRELALFGSVVRNQVTKNSDIDILVRFDGPATSKAYFGTQFYLEDLLGHPVDLVTNKALRTELRPYIEREAVNV